jgi:hypothetical protein
MRIFLALIILLIGMNLFASSTDEWVDSLPSIVTLIGGVAVAAVGVLSRFIKIPTAIRSIASRINKDVITFERIDKAVEDLLSRGTPPTAFQDWLGDVIGVIITRVPHWRDLSVEQKTEIIASLFAKFSRSKAARLLPIIDLKVLSKRFARHRLASQVIKQGNGDLIAGKEVT